MCVCVLCQKGRRRDGRTCTVETAAATTYEHRVSFTHRASVCVPKLNCYLNFSSSSALPRWRLPAPRPSPAALLPTRLARPAWTTPPWATHRSTRWRDTTANPRSRTTPAKCRRRTPNRTCSAPASATMAALRPPLTMPVSSSDLFPSPTALKTHSLVTHTDTHKAQATSTKHSRSSQLHVVDSYANTQEPSI